jgi:PAS domain S-box-containing protein
METSFPGWLFRRIVEEMPEAVIFADRQGVVRLWNRGAETMFGYSADEALGQRLDLIIPERFRADTGTATVRSWPPG